MNSNSSPTEYDIFISFRKTDGYEYAYKLQTELEQRGYNVFLDDEDLGNGPFYGGVLSTISKSSIFLAILSPDYFGLIQNEDDWVLGEIKYAISSNRTICLIRPNHLHCTIPKNDAVSIQQELNGKYILDIDFDGYYLTNLDQLEAFIRNHIKRQNTRIAPIFVSYTRADKETVFPFIDKLEKDLNVRCWIDLEGIETGEQFEDVIIRAINDSKIVLFMLSENSLMSSWTKREVYYAEGEKKKIIPIVIDGGGLRGWYKFHFGNVDYVDIRSNEQCSKLVSNLKNWLGIATNDSEETASHIGFKSKATARKKTIVLCSVALFVFLIINVVCYLVLKHNVWVSKASGTIAGQEYVDLGLPSGLKWARYNIGAQAPEEYGDYFAWGEIEQKTGYGWNTYKFSTDYHQLTKYNFDAEQGYVDSLFVLQDNDDVARLKWGGGWRIPNSNDYQELIDHCDYSWVRYKGVYGGLLCSRVNRKSIFFPAAGSRIGSGRWDNKEKAECWTVDIGTYDPSLANHVSMDSLEVEVDNTIRNLGRPVRAVIR